MPTAAPRDAGAAPVMSPGCRRQHAAQAVDEWRTVSVDDGVERLERRFWLQAPAAGDAPSPLLLSFHGQVGSGEEYRYHHDFARFGRSAGLAVAYPQGMDDGPSGTGWNVGTAGDLSTCSQANVESGCYASCCRRQTCGRCNWSTCHDDRALVRAVLSNLFDELCIDTSRVYLQGESNGGMLVHYLAQELPEMFAAVVPFYGLPLIGHAVVPMSQVLQTPATARQTAMLQLGGRGDVVIPISGGLSSQGFYYEPRVGIQRLWASIHECRAASAPVEVRWQGGATNVTCEEHLGCETGRRIMACSYDGPHGTWPAMHAGEEMAVWFMLQHRRDADGGRLLGVAPMALSGGSLALTGGAIGALVAVAAVAGFLLGGRVASRRAAKVGLHSMLHSDS